MAAPDPKSGDGGSLHLDEAVDPKLGVWGIVKESARITLKHRTTMLVVVVLFVLPVAAFNTFNQMHWFGALQWQPHAFNQRQNSNECAEMLVQAASIPADQRPTSTPNIDPQCLQVNPLNMVRDDFGWPWGWLVELAAMFALGSVSLAALVRAVVDAYSYDAEHTHSTGGGMVEWLKLRLNRKLLVAALRTLGTGPLIVVAALLPGENCRCRGTWNLGSARPLP